MSNDPYQNPGPNPGPYPNQNPMPNQPQNQAPYQAPNQANQAPYQAPTQPSNPGPAPKKKKSAGKAVVLIAILLIVLVLIVGCFALGIVVTLYLINKDKDPKPGPVPGTEVSTEVETREPKPTEPGTEPGGTTPSERETLEDREGVPTDKAMDSLTLYCSDGSVLTFTGNDFTWVLDPDKPEETYYKGTYRLYRGEEADLCLTHEYKNFDITQAELDSTFRIWKEEDLRVLVLSTEEARVDGKKTSGFETPYYSFFDEKEDNRFILINMNERVFLTFEKDTSEN